MNALVRPSELVAEAAEPRRHRFKFDELLTIQAAGILGDRRTELMDGEIIDMPTDGELHQQFSIQLTTWLATSLDLSRYAFVGNTTLKLGEEWAPSPDFRVFSAETDGTRLTGDEVLLAIEEAHTSLTYDLTDKAAAYGAYGIRDYWVIDLEARRTHVHREPSSAGYGSVALFERDQVLDALLIPGLSLRLADLPRVG